MRLIEFRYVGKVRQTVKRVIFICTRQTFTAQEISLPQCAAADGSVTHKELRGWGGALICCCDPLPCIIAPCTQDLDEMRRRNDREREAGHSDRSEKKKNHRAGFLLKLLVFGSASVLRKWAAALTSCGPSSFSLRLCKGASRQWFHPGGIFCIWSSELTGSTLPLFVQGFFWRLGLDFT